MLFLFVPMYRPTATLWHLFDFKLSKIKIVNNKKKASKAQNPYNFYFGNIAHSILNQNMKKNLANLLLLYRKWRKGNIRLFKKIACCIFFTKSNIYCINRKMLEDLAFLWMTELTFSCIAMVSENCFTSVLHVVWHLWTGIPAQDDCTTYHNSSALLCFASETAFLMSPHKFSIGLRSGDWAGHSITLNLVGLEPRCCSLTGVFGVVVLLKHPFQGHFLFGIRQHNLFNYFNILKLIHDPWNAINRPNT